MQNAKLIATDLDGTFLKDDRTISQANLDALQKLGENNIVRVAATGRNLKKVKEVLNEHVPFDYVVFSSGAGVFDWKLKKHLHEQNISTKSSFHLMNYFVEQRLSFYAFHPVPENHKHWHFRGSKQCEEFERYFTFNKHFSEEMVKATIPYSELSQFLIIIPEDGAYFEEIKSEIESLCPEVRVIRTSSPITPGFIWIEVFHHSVSKGNGVDVVCNCTGIKKSETVGLGNDYNDFDLLDFTQYSFLVENAPEEIQNRFKNVPSNQNDAFAFVSSSLLEQKV